MTEPRLTVFLPVYNGEKTLRRLLDSIAVQTFQDYRVVIVDNDSTDSTPEIARWFENSDRRFSLKRNPENLGMSFSYARGWLLAMDTEFAVYAGDDDFWEPSYLEKCVQALDGRPEAVLAYSRVVFHDHHDQRLGTFADDGEALGSADPTVRYLHVLEKMDWNNLYYGVTRTRVLPEILPFFFVDNASGDNLTSAHLALLGPVIQLDEPLFHRTIGADRHGSFVEHMSSYHRSTRWLKLGPTLPHCQWIRDHYRLIRRSGLPLDRQNLLMERTFKAITGRYNHRLPLELDRMVELVNQGFIYRNWEDETDPQAPEEPGGHNPYLDAAAMMKLAADLDYALNIFPRHPGLNQARALALVRLGRTEEARACLSRELSREPTHRPSLELKAYLDKKNP